MASSKAGSSSIGPLERGDGPSALTELETAVAEQVERLGKFLSGDAGLEVADGPPVVAASQFDATEGEIGQERLGHHGSGPFEGRERLVPVAEIRGRVAEIDQGLEVRAPEIENPPEGGLGDFGFAGARTRPRR